MSRFSPSHSFVQCLSYLLSSVRAATQATLGPVGFYGGYDYGDGTLAAFDGCNELYYDIGSSLLSFKPM